MFVNDAMLIGHDFLNFFYHPVIKEQLLFVSNFQSFEKEEKDRAISIGASIYFIFVINLTHIKLGIFSPYFLLQTLKKSAYFR